MNQLTSQSNTIPKLDLAPQLKRPLSIWNPFGLSFDFILDFFLSSSIKWYEDEYCGRNWQKQSTVNNEQWQKLRQHSQLLKFLFQGILLNITTPYFVCLILDNYLNIKIDWSGVAFGIGIGLILIIFLVVLKTWRRSVSELNTTYNTKYSTEHNIRYIIRSRWSRLY